MTLFMLEELWEAGLAGTCPITRRRCRMQPCTAAQGVWCCRDCMMCGRPCGLAAGRKRDKR